MAHQSASEHHISYNQYSAIDITEITTTTSVDAISVVGLVFQATPIYHTNRKQYNKPEQNNRDRYIIFPDANTSLGTGLNTVSTVNGLKHIRRHYNSRNKVAMC